MSPIQRKEKKKLYKDDWSPVKFPTCFLFVCLFFFSIVNYHLANLWIYTGFSYFNIWIYTCCTVVHIYYPLPFLCSYSHPFLFPHHPKRQMIIKQTNKYVKLLSWNGSRVSILLRHWVMIGCFPGASAVCKIAQLVSSSLLLSLSFSLPPSSSPLSPLPHSPSLLPSFYSYFPSSISHSLSPPSLFLSSLFLMEFAKCMLHCWKGQCQITLATSLYSLDVWDTWEQQRNYCLLALWELQGNREHCGSIVFPSKGWLMSNVGEDPWEAPGHPAHSHRKKLCDDGSWRLSWSP